VKPDAIVDALERVAHVLEQLGVRYYVGGSIASSVRGAPRAKSVFGTRWPRADRST
jgi:hypothetical protein